MPTSVCPIFQFLECMESLSNSNIRRIVEIEFMQYAFVKISLLLHHIHSGTSPSYKLSMAMPCSASRSNGLRASTRGDFAVIIIIRTNLFGNRVFSVSELRELNSLPASVRKCACFAQFTVAQLGNLRQGRVMKLAPKFIFSN